MLGRLRLTTGRAARVCGVTRRQLCYWTDQGIIEAVSPEGEADGDVEEGSQRVYDCAALRKVLLLKQSLERGWGVRRAAKEADAHLDEHHQREETLHAAAPKEREPFLADQAERLDEAAACLQRLAGGADRKRLVALAAEMDALDEVCQRILGNGTAMHEDVEGCLALDTRLDRLEAALDASENGDP